MLPTGIEHLSRLSAVYEGKGYALIPRLVDPVIAAAWELKHRALPGKRVRAGRDSHTMWLEQTFSDPSQALDGLAFADELIDLITRVVGLNAIDRGRTQVWVNRYRPGDHVSTHCDRTGDTQLLLCLQELPEPEKGGEFIIRDEVIPLRTGDAVLFFARGVPHGTVPIGSAQVGSSGFSRVTCVMRFFALEEHP